MNTRQRRYDLVVLFCAVLLAAVPALAHHSFTAEFNPDKEFSVTGVLSQVDWINPHTATWVDVTDQATGKVVRWGCEGNPPSTYSRSGLHRADWKIGEVVTLTCLVAKDGTKNWGFIKQIKYHSDGHVLVFRQGGN